MQDRVVSCSVLLITVVVVDLTTELSGHQLTVKIPLKTKTKTAEQQQQNNDCQME